MVPPTQFVVICMTAPGNATPRMLRVRDTLVTPLGAPSSSGRIGVGWQGLEREGLQTPSLHSAQWGGNRARPTILKPELGPTQTQSGTRLPTLRTGAQGNVCQGASGGSKARWACCLEEEVL